MATLAELVAPGGLIMIATLNRTWRAWLLGVVGAEYVLRWLPGVPTTGRNFSSRTSCAAAARRRPAPHRGHGRRLRRGERREPPIRDTAVNYMMTAIRD